MTGRKSVAAALALLLAASTPGTMAADDDSRSAGPSSATSAKRPQPARMRASEIIGATVYDRNNVEVGSVRDLLLDSSGRVADVIIDIGGMLGIGGRHVAVTLADLKTDNDRLTVPQSKAELEYFPRYPLDRPSNATGSGTRAPPAR